MTQIKRRKVQNGLKRKGFVLNPNKINDIWYVLTIDLEIEPRVQTFMSRGGHGSEISEDNIHNMVRELHMDNKKQFLDYINCPYKYEPYINDLRRKGVI